MNAYDFMKSYSESLYLVNVGKTLYVIDRATLGNPDPECEPEFTYGVYNRFPVDALRHRNQLSLAPDAVVSDSYREKMKDNKELESYFQNRNASFDEMPESEVNAVTRHANALEKECIAHFETAIEQRLRDNGIIPEERDF